MENMFELWLLPVTIMYGIALVLVLLLYALDWAIESGFWILIVIAAMMLTDIWRY
jgi:hypothetical protein